MKPNVKHKMDSKSKINYKSMKTDELIHLISNQILNEEVTENNKLVIQDCCKELFTKKETLCKYKKITYVKSKAYFDDNIDELCCSTKVRSRIVEVEGTDVPFSNRKNFPEGIHHTALDRFNEENYISIAYGSDVKYTVIKVEDA